MDIICPACGKANAPATNLACARCGCELATLEKILRGAGWHLRAAAQALRGQDWAGALKHAQRSWSLRHSIPAAELAGLAAAALGDAEEVLQWQRRTTATTS